METTEKEYKKIFFDIWQKGKHFQKLDEEEKLIYSIMNQHPEYYIHYESADTDDYNYSSNEQEKNPFLHLALHIIIEKKILAKDKQVIELYNKYKKEYEAHSVIHLIIKKLILGE